MKRSAPCIAALFLASTATSTIINVPVDQPTVQAGIDASVDGDTVLIAPGRYYENISFRGKNIVVASNFILSKDTIDIAATILDGSQPTHPDTASVVRIVEGEFTAVLMGFVITGGTGTDWTDPNFSFTKWREGGGILVNQSTPTIQNNIVVYNYCRTVPAGVQNSGGGGIRAGYSAPIIKNNVFAYNTGFYGNGVYLIGSNGEIKNNIVIENSGGESYGGGGIWIGFNGTAVQVDNNTVVGNTSLGSQGGGGMLIFNNGRMNSRNNVVWNNTGGEIGLWLTPAGNVTVDYTDVPGGYSGTGNFDSDPLLENEHFYATGSSPIIDLGDPDNAYDDIEDPMSSGNALFPSRGTTRNDVGAYGGPGGDALFPNFTTPHMIISDSLFDFENIPAGDSVGILIPIGNDAIAPSVIDSIINKTSVATISLVTPLPLAVPVYSSDTLALYWSPLVTEETHDTLALYHSAPNVSSPWLVVVNDLLTSCCMNNRGNANGDVSDAVNISDLTYLVDYLFGIPNGPAPVCIEEGNINGDAGESINISDVTYLVAYLFGIPNGPAPPPCF
jgi:hypothetical protein